ncbi:MAG: MgtC/SapB family protein [Rhodospirillales bacterium]|nr:MAG: MgtC/SapB family protein [Rhodospirillales bacterium]TVR97497.1 MAG: MgtC/SapB family protein [Rhodospirillales bacterium]
MNIEDVVLRLAVALLLGAVIGFERQWRQRMAGLRTNVLVALGAASFTVFSMMTPEEVSPTRVAAQVVSGIGFLGAGVIMRTGVNIQGLNTAATLWCAAAVGVFAGAGYIVPAVVAAGFVTLTNLALRPVVRLINRQPLSGTEIEHHYHVEVVCRPDQEAHVRALLLQGVSTSDLRLRRLESKDMAEGARVMVNAEMVCTDRCDIVLEHIVGRLSLEPSVMAASWSVNSEDHANAPPRSLFGR